MGDELPVAGIQVAIKREREAVARFVDNLEDEFRDGKRFEMGTIETGDVNWRIVVRESGQGNKNAAKDFTVLRQQFDLDVAFLVGTAGGLKDVSVGDIVIADTVKGYEFGSAEKPSNKTNKTTENGPIDTTEYKTDDTSADGSVVRNFIPRAPARLGAARLTEGGKAVRDSDWHAVCSSEDCDFEPQVYIAPVASGSKVVKDDSVAYRRLRELYDECVAVEMEGIGFYDAARDAPNVPALAVLGVSDFVDLTEDNEEEDEDDSSTADEAEDNRVSKEKAERENYMEVASEHSFHFVREILALVPEIFDEEDWSNGIEEGPVKTPPELVTNQNEQFISKLDDSELPRPDGRLERRVRSRDAESDFAEDNLETYLGPGARVILTGQSGSGKSALLARFAEQQARRDANTAVTFLDMRNVWSSDDLKGFRDRDGWEEQLDHLLRRSSLTGIDKQRLETLCEEADRLYVILDGLNEVGDEAIRNQTLQILNDCVCDDAWRDTCTVLVSTRNVAHYGRPARWTELQLQPFTDEQVRNALKDRIGFTKIETLDETEQNLLKIPYFLQLALDRKNPRLESKATALEAFFTDMVDIDHDDHLDTIGKAAFEMYHEFGTTSFSLDRFDEYATQALSAKLQQAGIVVTENDGESANFSHQLQHDYFAARYMASTPKTWDLGYFDDVTQKRSSNEVLGLTLQQISDPSLGREFLNTVNDWSWSAAFACLEGAWSDDPPFPEDVAIAILFMAAEKQFSPFRYTREAAADLDRPPKDIADELFKTESRTELLASLDDYEGETDWFDEWRGLFGKRPGETITESEIQRILSGDSILGWTVANVLKRPGVKVADDRMMVLRSLLSLADWTNPETEHAEIDESGLWRIVHTLGSYPDPANRDCLIEALDADFFWIRYGTTRSLVEMAAQSNDKSFRATTFEQLETRIGDMDPQVRQEAAEALFFDEDVPSDWENFGLRLLEQLQMEADPNDREWFEIKRDAFQEFTANQNNALA